ncbi:zinc-binding dehydrogenase [Chloroflexota bacterium]
MERPEPKVREENDVLVEVGACGICGSDLTTYLSEERMISWMLRYGWPQVLGHEIGGTVRDVGKEVTGFKPGDKVACHASLPCGFCFYCSRGQTNLCEGQAVKSLRRTRTGGYAKYVLVTPHYLLKMAENVPVEEAALVEPLGVSLHAIERSHVKPGDSAVIIGPGALGILAAMLLKLNGVQTLVVAGRRTSRERLNIASEIGAITVEINGDNLLEETRNLTAGLGADVVFDFAGGPEAMFEAIKVVRKGGEIVMVGAGASGGFDQNQILIKELTILGSLNWQPTTWYRAVNLVANQALDLGKILTHSLPLEEYDKAFQLLIERKALKAILVP